MTLDLLKRAESGSPLTATQHDDNFTAIESEVNARLLASAAKALSAKDTIDSAALIADGIITLAKLVSIATDKLIGRATAGSGVPELIALTAAGRALIDDVDAAAQRVTLGVDGALGQRTVTGDTTLALTDQNLIILANKATAMTITIPPQSSVVWPANALVHVLQIGVGATSIAAGAGVTIRKPPDLTLTIRNQYSLVSLWRQASDVWHILGALGTA